MKLYRHMIDPNEYIGERPSAYSIASIDYEPSENLNNSLRKFIKSDLQDDELFAHIALHSVGHVRLPIVSGGRKMEHPPEYERFISRYQKNLRDIQGHQLSLASYVSMRTLGDKSLAVHFELLPNEAERRMLGKLALIRNELDMSVIGVFARIPHEALNDAYDEASAELRNLIGMSHPSRNGRQHATPAPQINKLWVTQPTLRDKEERKIVPQHPDIISE